MSIRRLSPIVALLVLTAVEAQLTACKGGSLTLDSGDTGAPAPDDSAAHGCAAPTWRDRGNLGAEVGARFSEAAVTDHHALVAAEDGAIYGVERDRLVGAEGGVHYRTEADVVIGGPLRRVAASGDLLLLGGDSLGGSTPGGLGGSVVAIDQADLHGEFVEDGEIANPNELYRLPFWGVVGTDARPHAQSADVDADVNGDSTADIVVRAGGALVVFDGAAVAAMPADAQRSALDEGMAWGVLGGLCNGAVPVDTAVFGTGAAEQGLLAVSCPAEPSASVGSVWIFELPLAGPEGDYPPPNDITEENEDTSFALTAAGGGNLLSQGVGSALYVASPGAGRLLELKAQGSALDTLEQRYIFSPELPGGTEPVGRFGAAVALVRDGSGCSSLVVSDPAYPLASGDGYGAVYAVPVELATSSFGEWSAWRAPYGALMTDPKEALGAGLSASPDGTFLAVSGAADNNGLRSGLVVLSVE